MASPVSGSSQVASRHPGQPGFRPAFGQRPDQLERGIGAVQHEAQRGQVGDGLADSDAAARAFPAERAAGGGQPGAAAGGDGDRVDGGYLPVVVGGPAADHALPPPRLAQADDAWHVAEADAGAAPAAPPRTRVSQAARQPSGLACRSAEPAALVRRRTASARPVPPARRRRDRRREHGVAGTAYRRRWRRPTSSQCDPPQAGRRPGGGSRFRGGMASRPAVPKSRHPPQALAETQTSARPRWLASRRCGGETCQPR